MLRTIAVTVAVAAALSACSTLSKDAPAPAAAPPAFSATIHVGKVTGSAASGVRAPAGAVQALSDALQAEFAQTPQGGPEASMVFTISEYRPAGRKTKAKPGAPARMTVKVSITTPSGSALRQFAVTREANPAAADAKADLIAQVSAAIAKAARGEAAPT